MNESTLLYKKLQAVAGTVDTDREIDPDEDESGDVFHFNMRTIGLVGLAFGYVQYALASPGEMDTEGLTADALRRAAEEVGPELAYSEAMREAVAAVLADC